MYRYSGGEWNDFAILGISAYGKMIWNIFGVPGVSVLLSPAGGPNDFPCLVAIIPTFILTVGSSSCFPYTVCLSRQTLFFVNLEDEQRLTGLNCSSARSSGKCSDSCRRGCLFLKNQLHWCFYFNVTCLCFSVWSPNDNLEAVYSFCKKWYKKWYI